MKASVLLAEIAALILEHGDAEVLVSRLEPETIQDGATGEIVHYHRLVALGTATEVAYQPDDEVPLICVRINPIE